MCNLLSGLTLFFFCEHFGSLCNLEPSGKTSSLHANTDWEWCNTAVNPMEVERPLDGTTSISDQAEVSLSIESNISIESVEVEGTTKTTQLEQTGT